MNVTCSSCQTVFRVDPRKVPAEGIRARCSVCRGVFTVERVSVGDAAPEHHGAGLTEAVASATAAAAQPIEPSLPTAPAPQALESGADGERQAVPAASPAPAGPKFGAQDPHSKARRLARALVSDMVIYHPERQERGLRESSLRKEFKEEIRKSWEEFVEQVGKEMAHGTPYFRDALNEILARGKKVF